MKLGEHVDVKELAKHERQLLKTRWDSRKATWGANRQETKASTGSGRESSEGAEDASVSAWMRDLVPGGESSKMTSSFESDT